MATQTEEIQSTDAVASASIAKIDQKIEVTIFPVADVDRAKEFYLKLGWRLDADFTFPSLRVVQVTPHGSACSLQFGKNMTSAFQDLGLFPPLVIRMLRIGENTGALDTALMNVGYFYNREVKESIGRLQAMIEPAMTLVLGAILGWVMLSVLGPVYDSISKMKF